MSFKSKVRAENIITVTADLIRRDRSLAGLGLLLNPDRLLAEMHGQLDVSRVDKIKLVYLRYKPGMNCLARYVLQADGLTFTAYAKAHGKDAVAKLGKSMERSVIDGVLGPGRVALKDHQIIFSTFPNDAKLASLQCLADDDFRRRLLIRLFGRDSQWQDCTFGQSLNYKPERRYVVRLERANGESALAKFYSRSDYAKARTISRKLGHGRGGFYPETIGRSKKHAVVAYHWQPGITPRQLQTERKLERNELVAVAESLSEFHASECGGLLPLESGEQNKRLNETAEQTGVLLPHLEQRAKRIAQQLVEWLANEAVVRQPVHGDFYDKQAIITNGKARLIDLDAARLDNPLVDIGCYLSHLERQVGSQSMARADMENQKEILVSVFERLTSSISRHQLNMYIAMGLFDLIHQPFRDWEPDWPVQTELLLGRVENLIAA